MSSSGRCGFMSYSFPGKQGNGDLNRTKIGFSDLSGLPTFPGWYENSRSSCVATLEKHLMELQPVPFK